MGAGLSTPALFFLIKMTYRIFKTAKGYWFQCHSFLGVRHGPYATRQKAKTAAVLYVKDW